MNIEQGMLAAWEQGCDGYTPIFRGEAMAVECGDPEVSLANLIRLLDAGLHPIRYRANADRSILVEFEEGGSYLATGFSFGEPGPATMAFGDFATLAHGPCEEVPHYVHLMALPVDATLEDGGYISFEIIF
jgi:hypothetical protein